MNILAFLFIGLIVGWLASVLVKGQGLGAFGDIVVGIIGALVGGYVFGLFGVTAYGIWGELGMSLVGAILFLYIVRLLSGTSDILHLRRNKQKF